MKGYKMICKVIEVTPKPIKVIGKRLWFDRVWDFMRSKCYSKFDVALSFQQNWVEEFKMNKLKVLEYWIKYRYFNEINKICKITDDSKVLDVGCGISTVLHFVKGERVGIDPLADEYLKLYKYPHGIKIQSGKGEKVPFLNEYFDVVFCSNVLDHVTDPQKTVEEIFRVLKNDAYFILTIEIFQSKKRRDPAHPHSLTRKDIYALVERNKFKIIFVDDSPWIGLRGYVKGSREAHHKELVMILKKS